MTIEEFGDVLGLELEILQRPLPIGDPSRYYAQFKNCGHFVYVKEDGMLRGAFGSGHTPHEAVRNYAAEIAGEMLVISEKPRREARVPEDLSGDLGGSRC